MNLIESRQRRAGENSVGDAPPVLGDQRWIVARTEPAVERGELARRHAAAATEEAVRVSSSGAAVTNGTRHRSSLKKRSSSI
jgi:2',3'-cyclic-nucleotide 2'-phosphodiesterase (5'-nucleotidase family)